MRHLVSAKIGGTPLGVRELFKYLSNREPIDKEKPYYTLGNTLWFPFTAGIKGYCLYAPGWEDQIVHDPERLSWKALGEGGTIYFNWEIIIHEQNNCPIAGFLIATPSETEPTNLQPELQ